MKLLYYGTDPFSQKHGVKISFSAIAKALQKSESYIQQTATKFYGEAIALDYYIPKTQPFTGLDVLGSRSLFDVLQFEQPLNDSIGIVKSILNDLGENWFALPEKYRDACIAYMIEQHPPKITED